MESRTVIRGWYLLGIVLTLTACVVAAASVLSAEQAVNAALFAGLPLALVAFGGYSLLFRKTIDDFYRRKTGQRGGARATIIGAAAIGTALFLWAVPQMG